MEQYLAIMYNQYALDMYIMLDEMCNKPNCTHFFSNQKPCTSTAEYRLFHILILFKITTLAVHSTVGSFADYT